MEKRSKTNKEIYVQKYPFEKVSRNPIWWAEAIGYLKALIQYFPREQTWAEPVLTYLMLAVLFYKL